MQAIYSTHDFFEPRTIALHLGCHLFHDSLLFHLLSNTYVSKEFLSRWLWHRAGLISPMEVKSFWVKQEKEKAKETNTFLATHSMPGTALGDFVALIFCY